MAQTDEKAYAAVEEALKRNPDATLDEVWDAAKAASPSVGKIGRREFNARYPLQVKRRLQRQAEGGGGAGKTRGGAKRAAGTKRAGAKRATGNKRRARRAASPAGASDATESGDAKAAKPARRRPGRPRGSSRKAAASAAPATPAASGGTVDREAIRKEFLSFATELVNAGDQPKNLVKVLAGVDSYVNRVAKATR